LAVQKHNANKIHFRITNNYSNNDNNSNNNNNNTNNIANADFANNSMRK